MLPDDLKKKQNMCMGGPCHGEKPPSADGISLRIYIGRDGQTHEYELSVFDWTGDEIKRYIYRGSYDDTDPEEETKESGLESLE